MKELSLQKVAFLSALLHLIVFLITFFVLNQSNNKIVIPLPYTVNLVSPEILTDYKKAGDAKTTIIEASKKSVATSKSNILEKKVTKKEDIKQASKNKKEIIEDKISAIAAKKKIEKIVELRTIISLKAGENKLDSDLRSDSYNKNVILGEYYNKVKKEIWQHWIFPDIGGKDIEAIISVKILKDGTISVQGLEKTSGNPFFDRSAINAITKASPLTPPPYEMEIGVRFYP
ncbi:MAG: cell envelope integrity protein TolA [Nitrospirota bacterium]